MGVQFPKGAPGGYGVAETHRFVKAASAVRICLFTQMKMNEKEIRAVILLLESTLGNMPPRDADKVVEGVIALLKAKVNQQ